MALLSNLISRIKQGAEVFTDEEARREALAYYGRPVEETGAEKFGREVLQGIMRSAARVTLGTLDIARLKKEPTALELDPQASELEKEFFTSIYGTKRVSGFAEAVAKRELAEEPIPFLGGRGKKAVIPLAIAVTALDFTGFGGGKRGVVEALLKSKTVEEAGQILKNVGLAEDIINNYADAFAKATKKVDVEKGLDALERFIKTTKPAEKMLPITEDVAEKSRAVMKERGFITSVRTAEQIPNETKKLVEQLPTDQRFYDIYTDKEAIEKATSFISKSHDEALNFVLQSESADKDVVTTGLELMRRYRLVGDFAMEAEIAGNLAQKATTAGQAVQAYSILNKLSPEGVLVYTSKKIISAVPKEKLTQLESTTEEVIEGISRVHEETAQEVIREAVQERLFKLPEIPKIPSAKVITKEPVAKEVTELTEDAAKKLANRISVISKTVEPNPIKDMVNTLYKVAQEVLPTKQKAVPRNQIELIGQAIRDKTTYKEVWDRAQDLVKEKYADNPEALDLLDNYFGKILDRPFALKQIERAVGKGIKETEINLIKLVREHYSKVLEARGSLVQKLVEQADIPRVEAENLAKHIEGRFDQLVKAKKESVLKAIFKERTPSDKTLIDKIIELSNLGAFDSATYRPLIAQRFGIPTLSEILSRKLVAQAEKIQRLPFGYEKYKATKELTEMIEREVPHSLSQKSWNWFLELSNIPRALIASFFDFSFGFRQGLVAGFRHPQEFFGAFKAQFKPFIAEKNYEALMDTVMKHSDFALANQAKVAFSDINAKLTLREERYMSSLAEKIPVIGRGVRATNRAYTAMANKLRMDTFASLIKNAEGMGLNPRQDQVLLNKIASLVNDMSGRGDLPKSIRSIQALLNAFFFSPRLIMSRVNLLVPAKYIAAPTYIRKEYLKTMLSYGTGVMTILGLAKLAGAEVGLDPRSADFGKIKIGNTRIDVSGGFQQYLRMAAQMITDKYVSSSTGKIVTLGEGYKPLTRRDILGRMIEAKESPLFSFLTTLMKGQTPAGEDINVLKELGKRFVPIMAMDIYELTQDDPHLLPLAMLDLFGVGLQTYAPPEAYVKLNEIRNSSNPIAEWNKLQKEDKLLAQKVERAGIESNFTEFDWSLTYMGVENGERAKFLYEYLQRLPDDNIKREKWNDLIQKKLVSRNVAEQVQKLFVNPNADIGKK